MANQFVQVPPNSTGLKMQLFENTVGANVVESEAVTLVRSSDNTEIGTTAQPINDNVTQWGGTAVSAPPATTVPATGAEVAPVVKTIIRKATVIQTTTPLGSNGTFTSAWFDTNQTGDTAVEATVFNGSGGNLATQGFQLHGSDDTGNANFTVVLTSSNVGNNQLITIQANLIYRYWRVLVTNGSTAQSSMELTTTVRESTPRVLISSPTTGSRLDASYVTLIGPNASNPQWVEGTQAMLQCANDGSITGVPGAAMTVSTGGNSQFMLRTPVIFKNANATASGNTALWTPTAGKKFRMMRYQVVVPGTAIYATTAGGLTITFQDSTTGITGVTHKCQVGTAATPGTWYNSGWVDLGNGILSAAANNVLNINLTLGGTGALTDGAFVNVCGTEE